MCICLYKRGLQAQENVNQSLYGSCGHFKKWLTAYIISFQKNSELFVSDFLKIHFHFLQRSPYLRVENHFSFRPNSSLFWICFIFCPIQAKHYSIEKFSTKKHDKLHLVYIKAISFCTKYLKIWCLSINLLLNQKQMLINLLKIFLPWKNVHLQDNVNQGFFLRFSQNFF